MSRSRGRGLLFALLAAAGLLAVLVLVKVFAPSGKDARTDLDRGGAGAPSLVKGAGTTWLDDEPVGAASCALEGVVLDGEGRPVDGARVTLSRARGRREDGGGGYSFLQPRGVGVSAGGGRFRIDGLVPGDYLAAAMADGWAPAHREVALAERQTGKVELRLRAGGLTLEGAVLDVGGGGVSGARITAFGRGQSAARAPLLFQTASDGEGRYRMTLARGPYLLRVEAEGYAAATEDALVVRPTVKDLRLVPAARLTGLVVERGTRQPVPQAEVTLTSALRNEFRPPREARADDSGRFEFTALEPGRYEVMARKGALVGAGDVVGLAVAQSVDAIEVQVDRAYTISGRVKDAQGAGVPGVAVTASRETPPFGQAARTRTGDDGRYALEGMLPGSYRVMVAEEGYGQARANAKLLAADLPNLDIVLPAASRLQGRVLSASGQPVEGARVQASYETSVGGGMMMSGDGTVSGADGRFALRRATAGRLRVGAWHEREGTATFGPEELKPGETRQLELRLQRGASISGTVRTADGKPAPGVHVSGMAREARLGLDGAHDVTGPDGQYRLTGLPALSVTLQAHRSARPSYAFGLAEPPGQRTVTLADGEQKTGVDLVVAPAGLSIKGVAVTADGKPVAGAVVLAAPERDGRAFRGAARDLKAYSDVDGNFAIADVSEEPHTVWGSHPDHPDAELKATSPGSTVVRLQFPASSSVAGVVVTPDNKPVHHYTITILPGPAPNENPGERRRRQMNSFDAPLQRVQNPQGAFLLERLAGGTHELVVSTADGATANQVITVQAGEKKTGVRIPLTPGLRVTGRVLELGTNRPLPGSSVQAIGSGGTGARTDVAADGSFTLEGAPAGDAIRLSISADMSQYVSEFKELEVKPGQTLVDAGTIKLMPGNARERMMGLTPSDRGALGMAHKREGDKLLLRGVTPDLPAARAGLKGGDLLLAIDGKETTELGDGAINYLLAGKPGTKVTVTVASPGGPPRPIELTRDPPPAPKPPQAQR